MEEIKNIKKKLVLGDSGTLVECMLLDNIEQIQAANPRMTDDELVKTYNVLQTEITAIKEQIQND